MFHKVLLSNEGKLKWMNYKRQYVFAADHMIIVLATNIYINSPVFFLFFTTMSVR